MEAMVSILCLILVVCLISLGMLHKIKAKVDSAVKPVDKAVDSGWRPVTTRGLRKPKSPEELQPRP